MELSLARFFFVFSISIIFPSNASDTIFEGQSLLPNQTMISKERKFEVGFFSPGILWQSFDNPTDTWLPGAMLGFKWSSDKEAKLVSWRNENDPAIGDYSLRFNPSGGGELFISNGSNNLLWRSGIWQGGSFASLFSGGSLYNYSLVLREDSAYVSYVTNNASLIYRIVLQNNGIMSHSVWLEVRQEWVLFLLEPSYSCKVYAMCGPNAVCGMHYTPPCRCLDGFVPRVKGDWDAFDFSGGCIRMRPLHCVPIDHAQPMPTGVEEDAYLLWGT